MNFVLLIVFILLILGQGAMSIVQYKYYQKHLSGLVDKYRSHPTYKIYSDVAGFRYLRTLVVVVVDDEHRIVDCSYLRGLTVFAKFKPLDEYVGMTLLEASELGDSEGRKPTAVEKALAKMHETHEVKKTDDGAEVPVAVEETPQEQADTTGQDTNVADQTPRDGEEAQKQIEEAQRQIEEAQKQIEEAQRQIEKAEAEKTVEKD